MLIRYSVFVVLFYITLIQCDVSHIAHNTHHSSVDQGTIEVLRKNISDYLVHLGNEGSPQMQLKHIFGATKQAVTGTVYTVQALLETAEGAKQCEIRVLEQPWFDFCQVRVSCENGGQYEVSFNPHTNFDASQQFAPIDYLPPQQQQQPEQQPRKKNHYFFLYLAPDLVGCVLVHLINHFSFLRILLSTSNNNHSTTICVPVSNQSTNTR